MSKSAFVPPGEFPFSLITYFDRFLTKLTVLTEYARMQHDAHGGYELGNVAVMLEDLQGEGFDFQERIERREEVRHAQ